MGLVTVTLVGADDRVCTATLATCVAELPFVELAFLASRSPSGSVSLDGGKPRYPSLDWLRKLGNELAANSGARTTATALHLCGDYVLDLLQARPLRAVDVLHALQRVNAVNIGVRPDRIQLNFADLPLPKPEQVLAFLAGVRRLAEANQYRPIVFQVTPATHYLYHYARDRRLPVQPLFDQSWGTGQVPAAWPPALGDAGLCGYAGGLGPNTLQDQLAAIAVAAGDVPYWIDMETGLRDNNQFDLGLVNRVLKLAGAHVNRGEPQRY